MQNALYFENSRVRPVPLLIGVKKKFLQRIITQKNIMHHFYIGKKYLPCWSVGKKIFLRGNLPTPPPLKGQMVRPLGFKLLKSA